MTFSKIDQDAAAEGEPLDAGLLQGALANADAARDEVDRRVTRSFHADNRPVLASASTRAWELGPYPLRGDEATLEIDFLCVVRDAPVRIGGAFMGTDGLSVRRPATLQATTATDPRLVTVTVDVSSASGLASLWLLLRSDETATAKVESVGATNLFVTDREIDMGGSPFSLDNAKRYMVDIQSTANADGFAVSRTNLVRWNRQTPASAQVLEILPTINPSDAASLASQNYDIVVREIGQMEIWSYTIRVGSYKTRPDLAPSVQPALESRATTISQVYARVVEQHLRTRIHGAGPWTPPKPYAFGAGSLDESWGMSSSWLACDLRQITITYAASTVYRVSITADATTTDIDTTATTDAATTLDQIAANLRSNATVNGVLESWAFDDLVWLIARDNDSFTATVSIVSGSGTIDILDRSRLPLATIRTGQYPDDQARVKDATGGTYTTYNRSRLSFAAVLLCSGAGSVDDEIEVDVEATAVSWGSSAYDADEVTSTVVSGARLRVIRAGTDGGRAGRDLYIAHNLAYSRKTLSGAFTVGQALEDVPVWHTLRGSMDPRFVNPQYVAVLEGTFNDTEDTATDRIIRFCLKAPARSSEDIQSVPWSPVFVHVLSVLVYTAPTIES